MGREAGAGTTYYAATQTHFSPYLEEIRGYAEGAGIDFLEFWTLSLEDEFSFYRDEHCASIITNAGRLIAHNKDWSNDAADLYPPRSMGS